MKVSRQRSILLTLGLISTVSSAQIADPGALGGALRQNIEQQVPPLNLLPLPESEKEKTNKREQKPAELKVLIRGFRFEGVTLLSEQDLQIALKNWLNHSWTFSELQQVTEIVGAVYKKKGYLVQSVLPPQKIGEDGILLIRVVEAKLGAIHIDIDKGSRISVEAAKGFLTYNNQIGQYLNTEAVERAIYILKEVPGVAVATELEPGKQDGEANLKVRLEDTQLITGKLESTNYGSRSTGQLQGGAFISLSNPNGWGDQASLNVLLSEGSQYVQASYSTPVDYSGFRLGINASNLDYKTIGAFSGSEGDSQSVGASLTYPLMRSIEANMNVSFGYNVKFYHNINSQTDTTNSSYSISDWSFSLSGNRYDEFLGGGIWSGQISTTLGSLRFNSDNPSTYGIYTPNNFSKLNVNLARNQQLITNELVLNISSAIQLANANLDSSEKMYLGGPNGVRGFPVAQAGGSQGATITIELQKQFPDRLVGLAFLDAGVIQQYKKDFSGAGTPNVYGLYAAGVGAKWNRDRITVSGSMAWRLGDNPVKTTAGTNVDGRYPHSYIPYVWLQLQYALY